MDTDAAENQTLRPDADARGETTRPVLIIAVILVLAVGVLGFWFDIYGWAAQRFGSGVPGSGSFALLFLIAALMGLSPIGRRLGLTRRHLLAIYAIVSVGAPIVSYKVMQTMLATCTVQRYLGMTTQPLWQESFLERIPAWLAPTDWLAVEGFYHGLGWTPWYAWWSPLLVWCSFLLALCVCSTCLMLLLQRQWITHERLTFPLAQIPLEMVAESKAENGRRIGRLTTSSVFWFGLAMSLGLTALQTLSRYVPSVPAIPLGPVRVMEWQRIGPLAGLDEINLVFYPWLIAIAYLIPKDLSFSCWFFWFVRLGLHVIAIAAGATPERPAFHWSSEFPAPVYQGGGALLAIAGLSIWSARRHLGHAIRVAFSRQSGRADADEPIPYRWNLIAFLLSFSWLSLICWWAGCRVGVSILLVGLILVFFTTWVRLRAETGLGFLPYTFFIHQIIVVPLGSAVFTPREMIMVHAAHWSYHSNGNALEVLPGNALESMKIADSAGIRKRSLVAAMAIGVVLLIVLGAYITLTGTYRYGFLNMGPRALEHELLVYSHSLHGFFVSPSGIDVAGTIAIGAGALVTVLLGAMRLRFWWWPLHPIGYLAAHTWVMYMYYMPFMVAWLAKTLVVRYGGLRLYRRTVPLAIGFIAGDLLNEILWAIVTLVTGVPFKTGRLW